MKNTLLSLLLLTFCSAFGQPAKDVLLAQDHYEITENIKLMAYLDSISMSYYTTYKTPGRTGDDKSFYRFYTDSIVKNNPTKNSIPDFLGYKGFEAPMTWDQFGTRVGVKNLEMLMSIIEKYGYPGFDRVKPYYGISKRRSPGTFITRNKKFDKQLKPMLKRERKLGNISEKEYEFLKFILERKKEMTAKDIERLNKKDVIIRTDKNSSTLSN